MTILRENVKTGTYNYLNVFQIVSSKSLKSPVKKSVAQNGTEYVDTSNETKKDNFW